MFTTRLLKKEQLIGISWYRMFYKNLFFMVLLTYTSFFYCDINMSDNVSAPVQPSLLPLTAAADD